MPKRVQFAASVQCADDDGVDLPSQSKKSRLEELDELKLGRFKDKHSLDSDEEDENEEKKYGLMDAEEIEGCEESTIDYDEGIQITPFNMREEMEEGHFDAQGNYVWKQEADIKDAWMDNIDWVKVADGGVGAGAGTTRTSSYNVSDLIGEGDSSDDDDDALMSPGDKVTHYKKMITLMRPGDTVLKAIRRLGGGTSSAASSASSRWKTKRQRGKPSVSVAGSGGTAAGGGGAAVEQDRAGMLELTGLADSFLQRGDMEIYEYTHERLSHLVSQYEASTTAQPAPPAADTLDMFADEGEQSKEKPSEVCDEQNKQTTESSSEVRVLSVSDDVMWEYKESSESDVIHGPFTSSQMLAWTSDGGKFSTAPVLVRRCDRHRDRSSSSSDFYSSRRIDFDLYT